MNGLNRINMWKLKQKFNPCCSSSVGLAKLNSDSELVSNKRELLSLYKSEYFKRLSHRNIEPKYEYLKQLKENLFELRILLAKSRITPDWTNEQLMKVIKSLKLNKSRDSTGLVYELFKAGVIGSDVVRHS